jgi:hypothetical protein
MTEEAPKRITNKDIARIKKRNKGNWEQQKREQAERIKQQTEASTVYDAQVTEANKSKVTHPKASHRGRPTPETTYHRPNRGTRPARIDKDYQGS